MRRMDGIRNIVILTGAGISAESGLRTFRADDGRTHFNLLGWNGKDGSFTEDFEGVLTAPETAEDRLGPALAPEDAGERTRLERQELRGCQPRFSAPPVMSRTQLKIATVAGMPRVPAARAPCC